MNRDIPPRPLPSKPFPIGGSESKWLALVMVAAHVFILLFIFWLLLEGGSK
jgi:hypothetical protein